MKTIAYKVFGDTGVLQTIDEQKPSIQPNQVLVKVKAVSINPLDWKIRKGEMKLMSGSKFPKHTGTDFAGVIEDAGASVANFKKGDEVFGMVKNNMKDGALAEYVAVPSTSIWKKPAGISFVQGASIPTAGAAAVTAFQKMGRINPDSRILINGATGGFGMFLLQLLRDTGASVTAVTGTDALAFAKEWGAGSVVDYKKDNVLSQKVVYDIVIDLSAKMRFSNAKRIMKPGALFLNPVPGLSDIITSPVRNLFRSKKHVALLTAPSEENIPMLLNAISKGLTIEVSKTFTFNQAKEAYKYAEKGGYPGKIAIEVN
ncbi:NAD(P)-dependent alcohol dehydrogenase [Pararcticibacter amylolyticus]|uniref:NAD(P)-dependent alcohol dehydrogenase n=1 Tax=Pararcticibacter amylolyticus TaxID=2173175 RepID=A0A2U2PE73_9SPHI|nr:NAD(P)-dependent alcohol dehydrogenase [Pararcticibacter amylolyticus]PWG79419.1 NAD(P)-dependent alcohol dehydrogenase [Pararcticibacter amylolyticus]